MMHRVTLTLPLITLFLFCTNTFADNIEIPFGIRIFEIGKAPNFKLKNTDGETVELDNMQGKWVFLHFWASWCGPCREEMPTIQKLSEKIDPEKLKIIMINTAEDEDTIFTFLAGISVNIDTLTDKDGLVTETWKPRGLPTTFLINPEGQVKYQAIGGRDWSNSEYTGFLKKILH